MIVPTMTDEEIYEEIRNDVPNLNDKSRYCEGKFQAAMKKAKRFPFVQSFSHTTRERQNRFVMTFTARSIYDYNRPLVSLHCLYRDKAGEAAASINWQMGVVTLYTNHFFRRYRERVLKDLNKSIEDTVEVFFAEEWSLFGIRITEEIEEVFHCFEGHFSDDKVDVLYCTEKGYAFGLKKENLFVVKTIITDEMLSEEQRALFLQVREHHKILNSQIY